MIFNLYILKLVFLQRLPINIKIYARKIAFTIKPSPVGSARLQPYWGWPGEARPQAETRLF